MSCSNTPHVILCDEEEDDSFDWEAAVKIIDIACQRASSSAPAPDPSPALQFPPDSTSSRHQGTSFPLNSKKPNASRQSTLDRFVQPVGNRRNVVNVCDDEIGVGRDCDNDTSHCYCKIDLDAAKTWVYPVNIPLRDYQLSITKTALFANTLVALPTGLGKTFIAAVVMYNYFRWFPEGKIVFTAPSRPLVMQQIEACHNTVGIPQEWTIDLTGQTSPSKRACLWKEKRVFFVTPQVLEKDIQSGTCLMKHLVCLVIDEAHRAQGNYSYCVAVRELLAIPLQFRILALTATPGSKQQTIQSVINNLQISKLEYRTDTDHDVSPYVQNRKLELIKVAMGKDATEIYDMFLEVIRPIVAKLSSFGVLFNRDCQMLGACDLLDARDKFRQAPPPDLSQMQCGEVEGLFGVLITLYHIRKLLSAHGIKPAYEMLEDKMQQGNFARYMSRNETIWNTKRLMQQNLSHGAPNPKLVKMMEILIDHFKKNDPKNSRVIIFSNFRGSVRDIMNSLAHIGESVKATEFIGQSSGKSLKGQTQKIQQAVLQKFRDGGYNIIVATSIGEEGLDIMEVDLVICFDANISPLRMIQRMGRTGRKNDGRVVVLACEGSEIKGYLRKQASSKVVKRHMRNGGMNSFSFHASSRMIPHICKPEVQFVEFSIEQFVPRGKKVKDDSISDRTFTDKLSDAEVELITKYFRPFGEIPWKPSLIAFPHFQAFPSRVHNVMHSLRTRMLIGTMQQLQTLSFSIENRKTPVADNSSSYQCLAAKSLQQDDRSKNDISSSPDPPEAHSERNISDVEASGAVISSCSEEHHPSDSSNQHVSRHCFLFETAYVSVEPSGNVSIASVPSLPFVKEALLCKNKAEDSTQLLDVSFHSRTSARDGYEFCKRSNDNVMDPAQSNVIHNSFNLSSGLKEEPILHDEETVVSTPSPKRGCINAEVIVVATPDSTRRDFPILNANKSTTDDKDVEMSPRLTNMVEEGVVPESPLGDIGDNSSNGHKVCSSSEPLYHGLVPNSSKEEHRGEIPKDSMSHSAELTKSDLRQSRPPAHAPLALCNGPLNVSSAEKAEHVNDCNHAGALGYVSASPINVDIHVPSVSIHNCGNASNGSPINVGARTPLFNLTNSCSNDWHLSSGEPSKSTQQAPKFKRLRKLGECNKRTSEANLTDHTSNPRRSTTKLNLVKHKKGKRKMMTQAKAFIEVEAEVSSDAEVSDDEEEDNDNSNDDSFIDDRINPTVDSTQAETIRSNMMAIYRRSLLTQSPMESPSCSSNGFNTSSMQCRTETDETGSTFSGKVIHSLETPQTDLRSANHSAVRSSNLCHMDSGGIPQVYMTTATSAAPREERKLESRKRKLSFHQVGYDPETNIKPQRLFHSEVTAEPLLQHQPERSEPNYDVFCDDQFYEGLDLDALEEQATRLLKCKSELSNIPDPMTKKSSELWPSPSFDLGI